MRIAFVSPIFPSPAEPFRGTYNFKLVESLQKKADLEVFCPMATPPIPSLQRVTSLDYRSNQLGAGPVVTRTTYIPYPSIRLLSRPFNGVISGLRLRPYLEKHRPDLVFAPWVHPEGYGALRASANLNVPVVLGALGSDLRRVADPISRHLVRKAVTRADAIITVSGELKQWAVAYGADPDRVYPVLNGCDAAVFQPSDRGEMRTRLGVPADAELVLFVGQLIPTKGIRELLQAATALFAVRPKLRVAFIGKGAMAEWLNQRVAQSPFRDRLLVLGPRSPWEISEWLGAANLLCLPSYSEGCPNVVVEALSAGRPVVASSVGGIPELLSDSTGMMTAPADPVSLEHALKTSLERTWDEQHIHSTAGRSWDTAAEEVLAVCREVRERFTGSRAGESFSHTSRGR